MIGYFLKRDRVCLKLNVQGQWGGRIFDIDGQGGGVEDLENWIIPWTP